MSHTTGQTMVKLKINTCAYQDLRLLPGIGQIIADRIWELRKLGNITPEEFVQIPRLKVTPELLDMIDFGQDHQYSKPIDDMDNYLAQHLFPYDEVQDYEDHGLQEMQELRHENSKQVNTKELPLIPPGVFESGTPSHVATPLGNPSRIPKQTFEMNIPEQKMVKTVHHPESYVQTEYETNHRRENRVSQNFSSPYGDDTPRPSLFPDVSHPRTFFSQELEQIHPHQRPWTNTTPIPQPTFHQQRPSQGAQDQPPQFRPHSQQNYYCTVLDKYEIANESNQNL